MPSQTTTLPRVLVAALLFVLVPSCAPEGGGPAPGSFADLQGPYLGQTPPGLDPEPFAPELLSPFGDVAGVVAAPEGREIVFWTVEPREEDGAPRVTIYLTEERDGGWTTPRVAPFSGEFSDGYPAIHPDGSRIYFQSDRPIDPAESDFQYNIWVADADHAPARRPRRDGVEHLLGGCRCAGSRGEPGLTRSSFKVPSNLPSLPDPSYARLY